MESRVFTRRSAAIAGATWVLVAVLLGLFGAPWGLAALTGFSAATVALGLSLGVRNGWFIARPPRPWGFRPWAGASFVGNAAVILPATYLGLSLDLSLGIELTLVLLLSLTGLAAWTFGYVVGRLEQLEQADAAEYAPR